MLVVHVKNARATELKSFHKALQRRGWVCQKVGTFRIAFETEADDEQIVKLVEHDVREAEYVAGLTTVESVCLLHTPSEPSRSSRVRKLLETGSDVNLI